MELVVYIWVITQSKNTTNVFEQEAVVYINGWWGLYFVYLAWLCFWLVLISPHNPE